MVHTHTRTHTSLSLTHTHTRAHAHAHAARWCSSGVHATVPCDVAGQYRMGDRVRRSIADAGPLGPNMGHRSIADT
eukprot:1404-Rhodomonas_salina.1